MLFFNRKKRQRLSASPLHRMYQGRRRSRFIGIVLLLDVYYISTSAAVGADLPNETARYLLAGVRNAREQIRTGQVQISGTESVPIPNAERIAYSVAIEMTFDFPNRAMHCAIDWDDRGKGAVLRTDDLFAQWPAVPGATVHIGPPHTEVVIAFVHIPDVRLAGFQKLHSMRKLERFEDVYEALEEGILSNLANVDEVSAGVYEISWVYDLARHEMRKTIRIDESRGFTILRATSQSRSVEENAEWPDPLLAIEADWTQLNGVWVPTQTRETHINSKALHLKYDWKMVNGDLPKDVFTVEHLGSKTGTLITDSRLGGEAIIVGKAGVPDYVPPATHRERLKSLQRTWGGWWALGISGVLCVVVVAIMVHRWRRGLA